MTTRQTAATDSLTGLEEARERTLALVASLSEEELARVVTPLLSPLIWDLGHIANFEQRRLLDLGDERLDDLYNPFEQPRRGRGDLPLPEAAECFAYMRRVRELVAERADELDPWRVELCIQHEQQHNETMLQLLRMLDGYEPPPNLRGPQPEVVAGAGELRWIAVPAGWYVIGSDAESRMFVYDNETRAHEVWIDAFEIASRPVTNGEFREWIESGGYERDEHWSDAGLRWLAEERPRGPLGWVWEGSEPFEIGFGEPRPIDERAPVIHVSWFEAEAYACAHAARLPTEHEWEVAASGGVSGVRRRHPWPESRAGVGAPRRRGMDVVDGVADGACGGWRPELANLDQLAWGTVPVGTCATPDGLFDVVGQVWEWTASEFAAYPGFEPFEYAEYSAPFFDAGYRVLRGGSWATRARTVDNRFRNWDLPQRRQIFSGFRLARDA